jgi:hypothetical protein
MNCTDSHETGGEFSSKTGAKNATKFCSEIITTYLNGIRTDSFVAYKFDCFIIPGG